MTFLEKAKQAAAQAQRTAAENLAQGSPFRSDVRRAADTAGTQLRDAGGRAKRGVVTAIEKIDPGLLADVVIKATALQERANAALQAKASAYRIGELTLTATIPPQIGFAIVRIGDPERTDLQASGELVTNIEVAGQEVESLAGDLEPLEETAGQPV